MNAVGYLFSVAPMEVAYLRTVQQLASRVPPFSRHRSEEDHLQELGVTPPGLVLFQGLDFVLLAIFHRVAGE